MIKPPPKCISCASEAAAESESTRLTDPHSGATWRSWRVVFGQLLVFCYEDGSYMTSLARDLDYKRKDLSRRFPGNTEPHTKVFLASCIHSPPPTLPSAFSETKIQSWINIVKPRHVIPNETTPISKQTPWLVDPTGLLASTLLPSPPLPSYPSLEWHANFPSWQGLDR